MQVQPGAFTYEGWVADRRLDASVSKLGSEPPSYTGEVKHSAVGRADSIGRSCFAACALLSLRHISRVAGCDEDLFNRNFVAVLSVCALVRRRVLAFLLNAILQRLHALRQSTNV